MSLLIAFLVNLLEFYPMLLFVRIILSRIPSINWYNQPWRALNAATEPVMEPFRRLIPPLGA